MSRLHERTQNNNTTIGALMNKKNPNDDIEIRGEKKIKLNIDNLRILGIHSSNFSCLKNTDIRG